MEKVMELINVSKSFRDKVLYKDVNIKIKKGEAVGIVGGNGSGKSVLFKIMTGLENPDAGEVIINGQKLGADCDFPRGVGIMVDSPGYIDYLSGYKNLVLLSEIQNTIKTSDIVEVMHLVGLDPYDKKPVRTYSTGMKQKLGIAQAIMENQNVILLDEPFNALDFKTNQEIVRVLNRLKAEGKTIIMTSHQHEYLEKICDRLYIIDNHEIIPFTEEIKEKYFMM